LLYKKQSCSSTTSSLTYLFEIQIKRLYKRGFFKFNYVMADTRTKELKSWIEPQQFLWNQFIKTISAAASKHPEAANLLLSSNTKLLGEERSVASNHHLLVFRIHVTKKVQYTIKPTMHLHLLKSKLACSKWSSLFIFKTLNQRRSYP